MTTNVKALTKGQVLEHIAQATELSKKQVAAVFDSVTDLLGSQLKKSGSGKFVFPGLFKVVTIRKPAQKGGKEVKNPFKPGEMMITKDKPARTVIKVRPLKGLKEMV